MSTSVIQADDDQLQKVATLFDQESNDVQQVIHNLSRRIDVLRNGGWKSRGASAFYTEIHYRTLFLT